MGTKEATAADEGLGGFGLPGKPDMSFMDKNAKVGQTYDQDRRGNMWSVEAKPTRSSNDDPLPSAIYFPFALVVIIASIIFFAQLTGNDDKFGGAIGDGAFSVGI